jgi:hypothetical protein
MLIKQDNSTFKSDRTKSGRDRYTLDGKPLTGVTTVCGMKHKGYLVDWAASEAYKHALNLTPEEIQQVIKEKDYAYKRKSKGATDKGTTAHDFVEKFVKDYINTGEYHKETIEDEEIANSVYRFYDWAIKYGVEFFASEESVYSREFWYAGTFDFICKIDGKTLLGDFKTSKQMDDTYFAQGAAYAMAIEENNPEIKFDGIVVVRSVLAKEGQVWYEKSSNGKYKKMVNEPFEVIINYNIEREKTYFLSLLNLYRYSKGFEIRRWIMAGEVEDYPDGDYPLDN